MGAQAYTGPKTRVAVGMWSSVSIVQPSGDTRQVGDELIHRGLALSLAADPEDRRGMDGQADMLGKLGLDGPPRIAFHPDVGTEQTLGRGGAQADHRVGPDQGKLGVEPRPARRDVHALGALMNATLAASAVAKVLDHVGDKDILTSNLGQLQAALED